MIELSFSNGRWIVDAPYTRHGVTVPTGFTTDLASIPRIFWTVYPPFGDYINAAIIHDYLYFIKFPRKEADIAFLAIMKEDKVGYITRTLFFLAVRTFGWIVYIHK